VVRDTGIEVGDKVFLGHPCHRLLKPLTAGQSRFAQTLHYGHATANRCHSPGTPLSW
jgi:hypothetical protein